MFNPKAQFHDVSGGYGWDDPKASPARVVLVGLWLAGFRVVFVWQGSYERLGSQSRSKLKNFNIRNKSSCQGQSSLNQPNNHLTHLQKYQETCSRNDLNFRHPAEKHAATPLRNAARSARWGRRTARDIATAPLKCGFLQDWLSPSYGTLEDTHTHKNTCL